jgi:hypothetical protein
MTAAHFWASEVFRHFVKMHVAMNDLEKKLQRALLPNVKAPHAGCLNDNAIIEIAERRVFEPRHQKSSAEGIRLNAILPPA